MQNSRTGGTDSRRALHDQDGVLSSGPAKTVKGDVRKYSGVKEKTDLHDKNLGEGVIGSSNERTPQGTVMENKKDKNST